MLFCSGSAIASAAALSTGSQPGSGISRELAASRANRLSDLRYNLHFTLQQHATQTEGHEVLDFVLSGPATEDLPIDFRDGAVREVELNGSSLTITQVNGHLVLPARLLKEGKNEVKLSFSSRIATAGAALTRYDDKEDGAEYIYSLFVPMDASMAFPCFDQPDLKARFTLSTTAPAEWTVIGNTEGVRAETHQGTAVTTFTETKPISTYLFAFAAGPWTSVHPVPGQPAVFVRRSQVQRATPEVPQLQQITAQGMTWLSDYFQQPFPFPKYDIVLIPGFPFGGMEHAGATFLREDAVLFRSAPTQSDRFGRNILTLHELTHQWFGDLVTMRWFDDLWLKEGFAQYMAYRGLDSLAPQSQAWKHFYEDIKPQAYGIDETEGTTPIFQNIPNLRDAKSAYGAIVYEKAPAILKQLEFRLGQDAFRDGLRLYLKQHAYSNAQWGDLIEAFHASSGQDVRSWADAWVLRRGMPEVTATWNCNAAGKLDSFALHQQDVLPDGFVWPMSNEILLDYSISTHPSTSFRVTWNGANVSVPELLGKACPDYVFANSGDRAYGRFLLDNKSEASIHESIASRTLRSDDTSSLLRSQLWGALWDNVHTARSSPRGYIELVLANLPNENDETLARIQGGNAVTALHHYVSSSTRSKLAPQLEAVASARMQGAEQAGLRIVSFRTLTSVAETPAGLQTMKNLLAGTQSVQGLELRPLDRWGIVSKLIAFNDPDASLIFAAEAAHDKSGEGEKYAFAALAGKPNADAKKAYFAQYLLPPTDAKARPEDWITQSLRPFNSWNQEGLTAPFLRPALDQLNEIKRDRKIFFLGAWLSAFLSGQNSPESLATVNDWLSQPGIDPDLRRKVLENTDDLARTVRIRQRFPE